MSDRPPGPRENSVSYDLYREKDSAWHGAAPAAAAEVVVATQSGFRLCTALRGEGLQRCRVGIGKKKL